MESWSVPFSALKVGLDFTFHAFANRTLPHYADT